MNNFAHIIAYICSHCCIPLLPLLLIRRSHFAYTLFLRCEPLLTLLRMFFSYVAHPCFWYSGLIKGIVKYCSSVAVEWPRLCCISLLMSLHLCCIPWLPLPHIIAHFAAHILLIRFSYAVNYCLHCCVCFFLTLLTFCLYAFLTLRTIAYIAAYVFFLRCSHFAHRLLTPGSPLLILLHLCCILAAYFCLPCCDEFLVIVLRFSSMGESPRFPLDFR